MALWNNTIVRATPELGGVQKDSQILMGEDRRQVGQKRNKNAYLLGLAKRSKQSKEKQWKGSV